MENVVIKETQGEEIPVLQQVLDATELFPAELLPDMLAPFLAQQTSAFWLTCHLNGNAVGLCYTVPEELADGTWNMLALAVHPQHQGNQLGTHLVKGKHPISTACLISS